MHTHQHNAQTHAIPKYNCTHIHTTIYVNEKKKNKIRNKAYLALRKK